MINYDRLPPAELVKTLISYDPETGKFAHPNSHKARGYPRTNGHGGWYTEVYLKGYGAFLAHNVVWAYMTGEWPPPDRQVDHIDRDGTNNQWSNLRLATPSQQRYNIGTPADHKYGVRGVYYDKRYGSWLTQIGFERNRRSKRCKTFAEAAKLRAEWVKECHRW